MTKENLQTLFESAQNASDKRDYEETGYDYRGARFLPLSADRPLRWQTKTPSTAKNKHLISIHIL